MDTLIALTFWSFAIGLTLAGIDWYLHNTRTGRALDTVVKRIVGDDQ